MIKLDPDYYIPLLSPVSLKQHKHHIILALWEMEWHFSFKKFCRLKSDIYSCISTISEICADKRSIETTINRIFLGHSRLPHEFIFPRQLSPARDNCCETLTVQYIFNTVCNRFSLNPYMKLLPAHHLSGPNYLHLFKYLIQS